MSNLKPLTMYYFSIDGRDGLAHVDDGKCVDSDMHYESYLRSIASSALSDIERLKYTYRQPRLSPHDKLSCLYSIKNIIESDVKVVCCDCEGRWFRFEPVSVSKIVNSLLDFHSEDDSDDVKKGVESIRSFLSSLDSLIEKTSNDVIDTASGRFKGDK